MLLQHKLFLLLPTNILLFSLQSFYAKRKTGVRLKISLKNKLCTATDGAASSVLSRSNVMDDGCLLVAMVTLLASNWLFHLLLCQWTDHRFF